MAGDNRKTFEHRLLSTVREALTEASFQKVQELQDLTSVLNLIFNIGSPPNQGLFDPDSVGLARWQTVIYCTSPDMAMSFINFILEYKVQKALLPSIPELQVHFVDPWNGPLPTSWSRSPDPPAVTMPKPFQALPPRGRRHVLLQLDKDGPNAGDAPEDGAENGHMIYMITFFGNLYPFRDLFEECGVAGTLTATSTSDEKNYIRYLKCTMDENDLRRVEIIMDEVLKGIPIYFVNMVGDDDDLVHWLRDLPSVAQEEMPTQDGGP